LRVDGKDDGVFIWAYAPEDVAEPGLYEVIFKVVYDSGYYDLSDTALWLVEAAV